MIKLLPVIFLLVLVFAGCNGGGGQGTVTPTPTQTSTEGGNSGNTPGGSWRAIGPWGGDVTNLAVEPGSDTTLYAGTRYGLYKTTDAGGSWNLISASFAGSGNDVSSIAFASATTFYVGVLNGALYKTTDGGTTFATVLPDSNMVQSGIFRCGITACAVDPFDKRRVYATGLSEGVYRSVDGGASWTKSTTGLSNIKLTAVIADPSAPGVVYAGTGGGLFKSTDYGQSWAGVSNGLPNGSIGDLVAVPTSPATIYAFTLANNTYAMFMSNNGGATWKKAPFWYVDDAGRSIRHDVACAGGFIYLNMNGVSKSSDGGRTWQTANSGLSAVRADLFAVDPFVPGHIYCGSFLSRLFVTSDGGGSWTGTIGDFATFWLHAVFFHPTIPQTIFVTAESFYKSRDGGVIWSKASQPLATAFAADPATPTTVYAGGGPVYKSLDGGETWTKLHDGPIGTVRDIVITRGPNPTVLVVADDVLLKSVDGGATWTAHHPSAYSIAVEPAHPQVMYAGAYRAMRKSQDGGNTWTDLPMPPKAGRVEAVAIDPTGTWLYAGSDVGVFRSGDGGKTWQPMNDGLAMPWVVKLLFDPRDSRVLYAGTWGGGVYRWSP